MWFGAGSSFVHADQRDRLRDQFGWCDCQDPHHHRPPQPAQARPWTALYEYTHTLTQHVEEMCLVLDDYSLLIG